MPEYMPAYSKALLSFTSSRAAKDTTEPIKLCMDAIY